MSCNKLRRSIISTIVFFDIFNYPLTLDEIFHFLYFEKSSKSINKYKIEEILKDKLHSIIKIKNNFYFLKEREGNINTRIVRRRESINKIKKAKRISRIFSIIPFIEMVAIVNFLPIKNTRVDSDIDLFIITKKNRIWISRFLCVIIIKLLRLQPTERNKKNKICLTFFITTENLNLKNIAIKDDVYFYYWLSSLYPIYTKKNIYKKFIKKNKWIKEFLPNIKITYKEENKGEGILFRFYIVKRSKVYYSVFKQWFAVRSKFLKRYINNIELFVMKIQIKKMSNKIKKSANKNTNIIISNKILKFHDNDMREKYKNEFFKKIEKYEVE